MPKRYTDTNIWKTQKWFKKLSILHKLTWKYLVDACDHAGIWKIDVGELCDDLGVEEFDLDEFIEQCNLDYSKQKGSRISRERIVKIKDDHLWITGAIGFQFGDKNGRVPGKSQIVNSALKILISFDILEVALDKKLFSVVDRTLPNPSEDLERVPKGAEPCPSTITSTCTNTKKKSKIKGGGVEEEKFNHFPTSTEFNGLPEININQAIQFIFITKKVTLTQTDVTGLWDVFKIKNLTGKKFYQHKGDVYSHFIDSLKYQIDNGPNANKPSSTTGNGKPGTSQARTDTARKW